MDKNINNTIRLLIKFVVRKCTLYYTLSYSSTMFRINLIKKRHWRISWPRSSQQNKDHIGLHVKKTKTANIIILQEREYQHSIPH